MTDKEIEQVADIIRATPAAPRRLWAFNRRTTEDQILYVRARTLEEAWEKARNNDGEDASDPVTVCSTYRRTPEEDPK